MKWPFKTLKQNSTWPMQSLTLQMAAMVLTVHPNERKAAAAKMIERCVRMGARLAVEFGMPGPLFVEVARAMIVKEGGDEVAQALKEAFGEEVLKVMEGADEAIESVQAQVAAAFVDPENAPEA